jgi:hypothetical protein
MSSRQAASQRSAASRQRGARTDDRIVEVQPSAAARGRKTRRGPAQPRTEDFLVTTSLPAPPLILDKELCAIEILLGDDLKEILAGNLAKLLKSDIK